ncbi:hypothetical protein [Lysinibacillus xylanilyticus]|uniref:hypothetical protein n=1 Tax=Lysinibacillus xylanilyticus TaxID=582475 RepID=UPI0036D7FC6F
MSDMKQLVSQIKEYEQNASFARKTNERELPHFKFLLSDIDKYGFGNEDLDLKERLLKVSEIVKDLEVEGITNEVLEELRVEIIDIRDTLVERYRGRMEAYATRQSNI